MSLGRDCAAAATWERGSLNTRRSATILPPYRLTAQPSASEQLLVSMDDKTRRFPSSLGIQHKVGWSMR